MNFLGSLPAGQKLSVVTLVGQVGSGKSFLANKIANLKGVFSENSNKIPSDEEKPGSPRENPTQKGLVMLKKSLKLSNNSQLIILELEGLAKPNLYVSGTSIRSPRTSALRSPRIASSKSSQPTDKLLSLACLISSNIVYVGQGQSLAGLLECLEPIARFSDALQKELNAELGAKQSLISTGSMGGSFVSGRSLTSASILDLTTTVSGDLKEIMCSQLVCVLSECSLEDKWKIQEELDSQFTQIAGVNTEIIRRNKTMECLKSIFQTRAISAIPP